MLLERTAIQNQVFDLIRSIQERLRGCGYVFPAYGLRDSRAHPNKSVEIPAKKEKQTETARFPKAMVAGIRSETRESRENCGGEKLWKRRDVEKSKDDFPTSLGKRYAFPTFPQLRRRLDY
jgi:hypothetical protein